MSTTHHRPESPTPSWPTVAAVGTAFRDWRQLSLREALQWLGLATFPCGYIPAKSKVAILVIPFLRASSTTWAPTSQSGSGEVFARPLAEYGHADDWYSL